jgi:serpin B
MVLMIITGTLTGCGTAIKASAYTPINSKKLAKNYDAVTVEELDKTYTGGINTFAFRMFSELRNGENIFLSPYSISMALSMLNNGADKETRDEMAKLLGYDQLKNYTKEDGRAADDYMNANSKLLMDELQKADQKVKINVANSIWLSLNGEFSDNLNSSLLAPVRYYYDGDIFDVDFTKQETLDSINRWVSKKTNKMIDPFLEKFSDKEMLRLFLANAVYFNGKWAVPFSPEDTRKDRFYGKNSETYPDMMFLFNTQYRYLSENGIQCIELPYGDGRIVMNVLIPEESGSKTIDELYRSLSEEEIMAILEKTDSLGKTEIRKLELPKFEMEYGLTVLNDALKELGMKKAFEPGKADFEQIGKNLYVGTVSHKAKIKVEEWGTEAAAATGIEVECTSAVQEDYIDFIVNKPFIFFIRDTKTDTILFMGEINDLP